MFIPLRIRILRAKVKFCPSVYLFTLVLLTKFSLLQVDRRLSLTEIEFKNDILIHLFFVFRHRLNRKSIRQSIKQNNTSID